MRMVFVRNNQYKMPEIAHKSMVRLAKAKYRCCRSMLLAKY